MLWELATLILETGFHWSCDSVCWQAPEMDLFMQESQASLHAQLMVVVRTKVLYLCGQDLLTAPSPQPCFYSSTITILGQGLAV